MTPLNAIQKDRHEVGALRWLRQLPRAVRAFCSVLDDRLFLNLPIAYREAPAAELDDAGLAAWARWALENSNRWYEKDAAKRGREVAEVVTMHGVIALALLVLKSRAEKAKFEVRGVTYRDQEAGDWRVTIERIAAPDKQEGIAQ